MGASWAAWAGEAVPFLPDENVDGRHDLKRKMLSIRDHSNFT